MRIIGRESSDVGDSERCRDAVHSRKEGAHEEGEQEMPLLHAFAIVAALALLGVVLWDGFEPVVLPRRIPRRFRLTRLYFIGTWNISSALARRIRSLERRENLLAIYGPLALLLLLALWVGLLI